MNVAESYASVRQMLNHPVWFRSPQHEHVSRRFFVLLEALKEWKVVLERYDEDNAAYKAAYHRYEQTLDSKSNDERDMQYILLMHKQIMPKLRLDIRCIYIFAKIVFISYAALLFEIAEEKSYDWKQIGRFKKRLIHKNSSSLLGEFNRRFEHYIQWFDSQVNLYRNDFIEHPVGTPLLPGIIGTEESIRITGQIGIVLDKGEENLLRSIADVLKVQFPDVNKIHDSYDLYHWICNNLEHVPAEMRPKIENIIRRIGLDSGDIEKITARANRMFADFLDFFNEWHSREYRRE
jgi:hypothetical protein